ncbi:MAG TPA: hypothetical protein VMY87_02490 [Armatimonadota bacterium]|nr:hypothetical protein [Armatimonadota bacterium]
MGIDIKRAQRALRSAGARGPSICAAAWPFGRERRLRSLLRRRLAVLEAKNAVVDFLFQTQRPLADLHLFTLEHIQRGLEDPEKRKLIIALSPSREVIAEELMSRSGAEVGPSLDQAVSELLHDGVVLRVAGEDVLSPHDVYLAVQRGRQPHYDISELNRLVREGRGYGAELRARARREASSTSGRSYDL